MEKAIFNITGMSCAVCAASVEKSVSKVGGVARASVNLMMNTLAVSFDPSETNVGCIVKAVEEAGFGASPKTAGHDERHGRRLIVMLIFTALLVILPITAAPAFLALTAPVLVAGRRYYITGFKNLFRLSPNMDSLIAIGTGAAVVAGYFESAAVIITIVTLGKYLEGRAKKRASSAIKKLMELVPAANVAIGDILTVKEGGAVLADGIVTEGYAAVDESMITGESLPAEKSPGDRVTCGTMCVSGYFRMEAKAVGENTTLAGMIRLVEEAAASKAPVAKLADKISGIFVPAVISVALCTTAAWTISGYGFEFALKAAISVLVISCPCALGLATPAAIIAGMGKGAANGILIKSAEALQALHGIDTVVLDKTGTLTEGKPVVTDVIPCGNREKELLILAASLEKMSGHPLAAPIVLYAETAGLEPEEVTDYKAVPGEGISGYMGGELVRGGNRKMMEALGIGAEIFNDKEEELSRRGKTVLYFSRGNKLMGLIAAADTLKPATKSAVGSLMGMGLDVIMLTGDNRRTAEAIGEAAGIKSIKAEILPKDKEAEIRALQQKGKKVAMVGDGINDAPALARADAGIAMGAGTDIAAGSADVVLLKDDLGGVCKSVRLSRAVMRNVRQNLFFAFVYNAVCIPVAAGAFYTATGWLLSPVIAAGAMGLSSVSVVLNALRLQLIKL